MPFRIVVPVDGSELSVSAADWAVAFARRTGAVVSICSVVDPMLSCMAGAGGAAIDPGPLIESLDEDATAFGAAAVSRAVASHVAATATILHGMPAVAIDTFARAEHADLIVLGTHARRGFARGILGSVTAAVVTSSTIAVVAIHGQTIPDAAGPIVVAVDDSKASVAAGHFALEIAQSLSVPLHLVHVCAAGENVSRASQAALDALAGAANSLGVVCSAEIRHGNNVEAIIAAVVGCGGSMLATGTHGRNAIGRLFLGSVAEGLVRNAVVPVLVMRVARPIVRALDGTPVTAFA